MANYTQPSHSVRHSLPLFSACSESFDPKKDWLDGLSPDHPFFEDHEKIARLVRAVKSDLLEATRHGCQLLLERHPSDATSTSRLVESLNSHAPLWNAMISVQKYGVIYLANRAESREFYQCYSANHETRDLIADFLQSDNNITRAINYAVHRVITDGTKEVIYPSKLVPPRAISSIGSKQFAIRAVDFSGINSEAFLDDTSMIWDLHDFAHQSSASLSPLLYGSKYFSHLQYLPPRATALIRSPGMRTADKGPKISDGIVFSELLMGLFDKEMQDIHAGLKCHTYSSLENALAEVTAEYLLARRSLEHPSTGKVLHLDRPVTAAELAVLVQNKGYELTASEIEQRVFTRGGPPGHERDPLDSLDAGGRLKFLTESRTWTYFEVRNTIKHRAHKSAYRIVASELASLSRRQASMEPTQPFASPENQRLLEAIFDALDYRDWETSGPTNLWGLVSELGCFDSRPNSTATTAREQEQSDVPSRPSGTERNLPCTPSNVTKTKGVVETSGCLPGSQVSAMSTPSLQEV